MNFLKNSIKLGKKLSYLEQNYIQNFLLLLKSITYHSITKSNLLFFLSRKTLERNNF